MLVAHGARAIFCVFCIEQACVDFASGNVLHFDNDTLFNIEHNIIGYKSAREFFVQRLAQVRTLRASRARSGFQPQRAPASSRRLPRALVFLVSRSWWFMLSAADTNLLYTHRAVRRCAEIVIILCRGSLSSPPRSIPNQSSCAPATSR